MIVTLEGPRAVGKTTLTDRFIKERNDIIVIEGFYIENTPKTINDEEYFYENQRKYITQKIQQMDSLDENSNYLIVRGPEGIDEYTLTYPKIYGFTWPVEEVLKKELEELRKRRSDLVLYLDADKNILKQRCLNDKVKIRTNYDDYLNLWYEKMRSSFSKYPNVKLLDTSAMSKNEVYKYVAGIFDGEGK